MYSVSIFINGEERVYKTPTILEAFSNIPFGKVTSKGVIKVSKDGKSAEMLLTAYLVKRMMISKVYRQLLEKRLNARMK